ncbi:MAG: hypothetical protein K9J16_16150 [Melioribacteraceae bacterium]|nr:hypothetical protein [Melioribacteraceae bacterium]MCF8353200.1 hypothetical protein [Melioribacteraceae bacterium]MCF8395333.1 hypothetical protein [Melioribacteraceae bacterium]MCF8418766.1 hypothetical protein [Melioribacteraceae bacterium]
MNRNNTMRKNKSINIPGGIVMHKTKIMSHRLTVFFTVLILSAVTLFALEKPDSTKMGHKMNHSMMDSTHHSKMMKHNMMDSTKHSKMMNHSMMDSTKHSKMMNHSMMDSTKHSKMMKHSMMDSSKMMKHKSSIVREEPIDLKAIDANGDGKVFQDQMDWNVISDEAGECPLCGMKLKEVPLNNAKFKLIENGFEVK